MLVLLHKTILVIFFPPFSPELFLFCQKVCVWGWGEAIALFTYAPVGM